MVVQLIRCLNLVLHLVNRVVLLVDLALEIEQLQLHPMELFDGWVLNRASGLFLSVFKLFTLAL